MGHEALEWRAETMGYRQRWSLYGFFIITILAILSLSDTVWGASASVTATDGGGAVTVTVNGSFSSCTTCDANGNNCTTNNNGSVSLYWGSSYLGGASGAGSATFTKVLDRRSVNGTQTFTGYAYDCTGSASSSASITIDNTPTVSVTGPSGTISEPFDITGSAVFKPTLNATKGTIYALRGSSVLASKTCTTETCNFSYFEIMGTLYDLSSGNYTITLQASGGGTVTASTSFTVDKTPTVSVTSPSGTISEPFDITGTAVFKPTLNSTKGTITALRGSSVLASKTCTTETCNFSYFEIMGTLYDLSSGTYTITLQASGGGKTVTASTTFTVDKTPTVSVTSPSGTISEPFDITGTAVFKPTLNSTKGTITALRGSSVLASKTCTTETCNFSYYEIMGTLYDLSSGTYTITLQASGGGKTVTASTTFTVDKTPTVSVTGPSGTVASPFDITGSATFKPTLNATKGTISAYRDGSFLASKTCTTENCTFSYQEVTGKLYNLSPGGPYTVMLTASGGGKSVSATESFSVVGDDDSKLNRCDFGSSANMASGNLIHTQELFALRGTGLPTRLALTYARLESTTTPLGRGWTHSYAIRLAKDSSSRYLLIDGDGTRTVLINKGTNTYGPMDAPYPVLTVNADASSVLTWRDGTRHQFSAGGQLLRIEDRNANAVVLTYTDGNLSSVTDSAGRMTTFAYNADRRITTITDPLGTTHAFTYTDDTLTTVMTTPLGPAAPRIWQYTYTPDGQLASKTDPLGHTTSYAYDTDRRVIQATAPDGQVRTVTYPTTTATIRSTTLTEQDGGIWNYTYDIQKGLLVSKADPLGNTTTYAYDTSRRLLSTTEPDGSVTRYTYDTAGNVATVTDALGQVTAYTYNATGQVTSVTDPRGNTTTLTYDAVGNLLSTTNPTGATTQYQYDTAGRVTQLATALNQVIAFAYDAAGNLTSVTDPLGAVTSYAYNVAGNVTSQTDALGRVTTFTYDSYNQPLTRTTPDGATTTWTYDAAGNRLTETDANSHTTTWTYNYKGQVLTMTDALGNVTRYTYGGASGCGSCGGGGGNLLTSVTDPRGAVTTYQYDQAGRRLSETDPLNHVTSYTYDSRGRVMAKTDANGKTTSYTYDAVGRLVTETDALSGITRYSYDGTGNLLTVTDAKSQVTQYAYDAANRKTQETRPLGQTTRYSYDAGGNLATMTDAKGQVTTLSYDAVNRLTARSYADSTQDTFSYNAVGNLMGYAGGGVSGSRSYNAVNRPLSEAVNFGPFTKTYRYTYDGVGNETSLTIPEGAVYTYAYNAINQPTGITVAGGTISATYDRGRISRITYPNGVVMDYGYNANSWITALTSAKGGTSVLTRQYTYDPVGTILTQQTAPGLISYGYDALYRLTDAAPPAPQPAEHYTYDAVGNRLTSAATTGTWTYNANNALVSYGATANTYDANGQLVQTSDGIQLMSFGYNARNRMSQVTLPDGRTVTYTYDPFGRRVKKDVAGTVTYFLYSAEGLLAEYDAAGTLQRGYGWWPQSGWGTAPLVQTEGGQTYTIHTDHLGTPQKLTDATGAVVWSATYTAFGEAIVDPASTITNNLRFPGQYYDAETGLHYNLNRDYDPTIGRYRQTDPIGLAGGDVNLYAYVRGNPLGFTDPFGLARTTVDAAIEQAIARGDVAELQTLLESTVTNQQRITIEKALEVLERSTKNTKRLADLLNRSESEIRKAIHACKRKMPRGGPKRNPDVRVDPKTGDVYPETGSGGLGDPIGNIWDYLH